MMIVHDSIWNQLYMFYYKEYVQTGWHLVVEVGYVDGSWSGPVLAALQDPKHIRALWKSSIIHDSI